MGEKCAGWAEKAGESHPCQFTDETDEFSFADKHYCRFHLPMGEEGEGGKADWDDGEKAAISHAVIAQIDVETDEHEDDYFENESFDLNFGGIIVPSGLDLSGKTIPGIAFAAAQFIEEVNFKDAQFTGEADFQEAKFSLRANFFKTQFSGSVLFRESEFVGDAYFYNAQFTGDANFSGAQFSRSAYFRKAQFSEMVNFSKAQLRGDANFSDAQFTGETDFIKAKLRGDAYFSRAKFTWGAEFRKAKFSRSAYFRESEFVGDSGFHEAQFCGYAGFSEAKFSGYAGFREAKFSGKAYFKEAKFRESADFSEAQFSGSVLFRESEFVGDADFHGDYGAENGNARSFKVLSFKDALFGGPADFSNREILKSADFRVQQFAEAPSFAGSRLHQDTTFPSNERFLDRSSERAADSYRILRLAMENQRDRLNEGMFYALEQESRRHSGQIDGIALWINRGYAIGSKYGLSIARPFFIFLSVFVLSWLLTAHVALYSGVRDTGSINRDSSTVMREIAGDALVYAFRQSVIPFDALRQRPEVIEELELFPRPHGLFLVLAAIQSVLSAIAILLLILAVRWRYRR
jgi:uncharacterized protein YjbI with pentapeptide repeats